MSYLNSNYLRLILAISSVCLLPTFPAHATIAAGADASVWDSAVAASSTLDPVGGSGQLNGEFILDTLDQGTSAIQVGLRAQRRFFGPDWTRVGNIYFVDAGESSPGLATWNFDWHLDFGTSNEDTGVSASLESQLLKSLAPLNMLDFTVELLIDTDPSSATDFTVTNLGDAFPEEATDVRLSQESTNIGFFSIPGYDPDVAATYDFQLRVVDPESGDTLAESQIKVVVDAASTDTVDLAVSAMDSVDPVVVSSGGPSSLTYPMVVANNGPDDATGVILSEDLMLPSGVTISSGPTVSAGAIAGDAPSFEWTLGPLAMGASATLTVDLSVAPSTSLGTDIISSTATVTAVDEPDSNSFNQTATASTSVTCPDNESDGVCNDEDNCPDTPNADQTDTDGDGNGNICDLCFGDDETGDTDGDGACDEVDQCLGNDLSGDADMDGICADRDCDDEDPENGCEIFTDGFESGNTSLWSAAVGEPT